MLKRVILIGFLIVFFGKEVLAQAGATRVLNIAEDNFEQGNLATIPRDLEVDRGKYFKKQKVGGFSKEESVRAYRLLTLVHLYNDNQPEAEEAFINLLKADPEHPVAANDPQEFRFLHEKFNTDPIFRIGIKVGAVRTEASSFLGFGSADNNTGSGKTYTPGINFMAEATFEYQLPIEGFEIVSGVNFSLEKFKVEESIVGSGGIAYSLDESQTWLKVPLMLRYSMKLGKSMTPYVYGGYSANYLVASTFAGNRTGGQPAVISADLIADDSRTRFNQAILGGIGLKLASKTDFIVFEARYSRGITNIVNSANRYSNQSLFIDAGYVDDNFSQNNIGFSVGYIKSFYNPRKLSEKRYNKKLQQKLKKSNNE